ncbi:hypothetical protein LCGC14_1893160, partial [marine sediment metagenome]
MGNQRQVLAALTWLQAYGVFRDFLQDSDVPHQEFRVDELQMIIDCAQERIDEIKKAERSN